MRIQKGDRYGKLIVIEPYISCDGKHSYSLCKCDCGSAPLRKRNDCLTRVKYPSCGCSNSLKDKKGDKYGLLTIIEPYIKNDGKHAYHLCKCECDTEIIVRADQLRSGNTRSCGCLRSKGEYEISKILDKENIKYIREYSFSDLFGNARPLRFDFAILKDDEKTISHLIEYNGEQHYRIREEFGGVEKFEKQQKYDLKKEKYCKDNNIPLIIIPYWETITLDKLLLGN